MRTEDSTPERITDIPLGNHDATSVTGNLRDSVHAHTGDTDPAIVSISDIHGYLDEARSALLTLRDHPEFDTVVREDAAGQLHWADNNYILVFNGDLVDRGPANRETLAMVARLLKEAPVGRIRITLGNHEMGMLTPDLFHWGDWFSCRIGDAGRRTFLKQLLHGHVVAAFEGYNYTYAHAGQTKSYDVTAVNDNLASAAKRLDNSIGSQDEKDVQQTVVADCPRVLGMGDPHPKDRGAGLVWLHFRYLTAEGPPQIVGHTRHRVVTQKGTAVCENVIRDTQGSPGGEAVLVETPDRLIALRRAEDSAPSGQQIN